MTTATTPICSSCGRTHKRMRMNGLCQPCYAKTQKDGTLKRTRKSMPFGVRECATCQSTQTPFFKDLCRPCYRTSLGLPLVVEASPPGVCEVPDCNLETMAHGLCRKHYYRVHNTGDINHSRPKGWGAKSTHPLYQSWNWINKRDNKPLICERWKDFWNFVEDMGERPSSRYRLRRLDDSAPFSKENCEWRKTILDDAIRSDHERADRAKYAKTFRAKKPDSFRRGEMLKRYGISLEDFNAMRAAQNDLCAICRKPEFAKHQSHLDGETRMLAIDHDHATGKTRGLLCTNCNKSLGHFKDDLDLLRRAIAYLEHHATPAAEEAA